MNVGIIGYGKMGHEIEKVAKDKGITIRTIDLNDDNANFKEINEESMKDVDVCIDFTHPDSVVENIEKISKFGKNIVVGTTGWYDKLEDVKKIIEQTYRPGI